MRIDFLRYGFLLFLATAIVVGIFIFPTHLPALLTWVRSQQLLGSILFIFIEAVCIWCVSPVSIFIIAAGFMYGLWFGSLIAYIGYVFGMFGSFFLGKTLLRNSIQSWLYQRYPSYQTIDRAIGEQGFKILLLFRLSPVLPCNVFNYICSLTSISFPSYALASLFGVIPTVLIFANIGAMIGSLTGNGFENVVIPKKSKDMMILLSCVFTTLSVVLIGIISRKALRQQLLPIVDEVVDMTKDSLNIEVVVRASGYFYAEKMIMLVAVCASSLTLIIGCVLIANE
eukprot:NODE_5_length_49639_cov_0.484336.p16 type:complete len:284 gc:universal NODE_5_length_49639_cov_0.484336:5237-6088(+)